MFVVLSCWVWGQTVTQKPISPFHCHPPWHCVCSPCLGPFILHHHLPPYRGFLLIPLRLWLPMRGCPSMKIPASTSLDSDLSLAGTLPHPTLSLTHPSVPPYSPPWMPTLLCLTQWSVLGLDFLGSWGRRTGYVHFDFNTYTVKLPSKKLTSTYTLSISPSPCPFLVSQDAGCFFLSRTVSRSHPSEMLNDSLLFKTLCWSSLYWHV